LICACWIAVVVRAEETRDVSNTSLRGTQHEGTGTQTLGYTRQTETHTCSRPYW